MLRKRKKEAVEGTHTNHIHTHKYSSLCPILFLHKDHKFLWGLAAKMADQISLGVIKTKELSMKLWDEFIEMKNVRKTFLQALWNPLEITNWKNYITTQTLPTSGLPSVFMQEGQLSENCPRGQLQQWKRHRAHWLK